MKDYAQAKIELINAATSSIRSTAAAKSGERRD